MQLHTIAFQSYSLNDQPFSEQYGQRHGDSEIGLRFLRLIEHLEQHVEAPPQWICTSHYNLHFFSTNIERFAGFTDNPSWILAVQARQNGFTITCRHHSFGNSETMRIEHPETIEETAHLVAGILRSK